MRSTSSSGAQGMICSPGSPEAIPGDGAPLTACVTLSVGRAMEGTTRECADAWVKRARRIVCLGVPWSRLQALQAGLAGGVEHMQALCRSLHGRHDLASIGLVGEIVEEAMADDESPIEFCMFLARLHAGLQGVARDLEDLRALARQLTAEYADELRESRLLFRSALDGLAATKIPPHEGGMPVARQCI